MSPLIRTGWLICALATVPLWAVPTRAAPTPQLAGPATATGDGKTSVRIELDRGGRTIQPRDVNVEVDAGTAGAVTQASNGGLVFDLVAPRVAAPLQARVVARARTGTWRTAPLRITFEPPAFTAKRTASRGAYRISLPSRLLLGSGGDAAIQLTSSGSAPELYASEGSIGKATALEAGSWRAAFTPGAAKRPRYGIVAAVNGDRSKIDYGVIALWGLPRLKTTTVRGAVVRWRLGGLEFGPVTADGLGKAHMHVLAAPGVSKGRVQASDASGSHKTGDVALGAPHHGAMLAICPTGGADIVVIALDERGQPRRADDVELDLSVGSLSPIRRRSAGVYAATMTIPAKDAQASIEVSARVKGDAQPRARCVTEAPGVPLRGLEVALDKKRWRVGDDRTVAMTVALRYPDSGKPQPTAIEATASFGEVEILQERSATQVKARWTLSEKLPPERRATVTVLAPAFGLRAQATLTLEAGPAASFNALSDDSWLFGDGSDETTVLVHVFDAANNSVHDAQLTAEAKGELGVFEHLGDGRYQASYRAPEITESGQDVMIIRDPDAGTQTELPIALRAPSKRFSTWLRGGLLVNFGQVRAPIFLAGVGLRLPLFDEGLVVGVEGGLSWSAPTIDAQADSDPAELELYAVPVLGRLTYELPFETVRPYLGVSGGAFVVYSSVTSATSAQTAGYHVAPAISPVLGAGLSLGPGRLALETGYFYAPLDVDVVSGNAGGLDVTAGYQFEM